MLLLPSAAGDVRLPRRAASDAALVSAARDVDGRSSSESSSSSSSSSGDATAFPLGLPLSAPFGLPLMVVRGPPLVGGRDALSCGSNAFGGCPSTPNANGLALCEIDDERDMRPTGAAALTGACEGIVGCVGEVKPLAAAEGGVYATFVATASGRPVSAPTVAPERECACRGTAGRLLSAHAAGICAAALAAANVACASGAGALAGPAGRAAKSVGGCASACAKSRRPGNMDGCGGGCMSCMSFMLMPDELGGRVPGSEGTGGMVCSAIVAIGVAPNDENDALCGGGGGICESSDGSSLRALTTRSPSFVLAHLLRGMSVASTSSDALEGAESKLGSPLLMCCA